MSEHKIDMKKELEEMSPVTQNKVDDLLTSRLGGYKNREEYHNQGACCHKIPDIKTPTLFLNALDDPLIPPLAVDFASIKANPNCVLATTRFGGHMGYFENCLTESQWWANPILDFLNIMKY